jgi:hypothetical protein
MKTLSLSIRHPWRQLQLAIPTLFMGLVVALGVTASGARLGAASASVQDKSLVDASRLERMVLLHRGW